MNIVYPSKRNFILISIILITGFSISQNMLACSPTKKNIHHELEINQKPKEAGKAEDTTKAELWDRVNRLSYENLSDSIDSQTFFPSWIEHTPYFHYNVIRHNIAENYLVNAENGKKINLIKDKKDFATQYLEITGESLDISNIQLYKCKFYKKRYNKLEIKKDNNYLTLNLKSGKLTKSSKARWEDGAKVKSSAKKRTIAECHSKDSLYTMMGFENDLYIRNNKTNEIKRITFDGCPSAGFTTKYLEDTLTSNVRGKWRGHCYDYLVTYRDSIGELSIINSITNGRPKTKTFQMPMPGDKHIKTYKYFYYNADTGKQSYLPIEKYPDQEVKMCFYCTPEERYFTRMSRGADKIDLCRINLCDGSVEELISEECKPHLNVNMFNYSITKDGKYIIWWSERTGRGNYYLYDKNGNLLNRITQGKKLVAGKIENIDLEKKEIIFAGYGNEGKNPYYKYYYKVNFDGTKQTLLTKEYGNHSASFSKDFKYFVDNCSRMDMLPQQRIIKVSNPEKNFLIESISCERLKRLGWSAPILTSVKADDGVTDLYGIIYLPSELASKLNSIKAGLYCTENKAENKAEENKAENKAEENKAQNEVARKLQLLLAKKKLKKYPIISHVYPGPQDDLIPQSFSLDEDHDQSLAELGFIVIRFASRGSSPLRGKDFYTYGYGNLRDYPLKDDKWIIEKLAERYPFIDLNRVGIYGHSGGGFQSATAILTYPDFYKVAVAVSGNYDNNIYIRWWGETYHGVTMVNDTANGDKNAQNRKNAKDAKGGNVKFECKIPTTMELADNLKGNLLLMTGDVDNNVSPSNTYKLAHALIKAGKNFDMLVIPGADHGIHGDYYINKIRYYFLHHLKNNDSDKKYNDIDIINHK